MIHCTVCGLALALCPCPGTDDRLRNAAQSKNVAFKWCRVCDKHYERCTCEAPQFYIISGGKEVPIPEGGFLMADGSRVIPDLNKK